MLPLHSKKKTDLTSADPIPWPRSDRRNVNSGESSPIQQELKYPIRLKDADQPATVINIAEPNCDSYRRIVRQCNACQTLYSSFHTCHSSSFKV